VPGTEVIEAKSELQNKDHPGLYSLNPAT